MSNHEHRDPQDAGEDAALRRAWRQASDELPPPELDAAIVAAARKSVQEHGSAAKTATDGTRSWSWFTQWQPLAAAATVAGLAFILLQVMPRDREVIPSIRMEESAPGPVTARPGTTEPPAAERAAAAPGAAEAAVAEQKTSGQLADRPIDGVLPGSASADADQQPAISPESDRANVVTPAPARTETTIAAPNSSAEADRMTTVLPQGADSGASVDSAAPASEERQRDDAAMDAADWAARVVSLYESGDLDGAASVLREFRASAPDADSYLPESLHDWARTVK
ncbi:MAG: hypothetical protein MUO39_14030 [Steroidobacteraceae bacterium]|nr:hypothetical protein [Steroidobacteraceae bacterium]